MGQLRRAWSACCLSCSPSGWCTTADMLPTRPYTDGAIQRQVSQSACQGSGMMRSQVLQTLHLHLNAMLHTRNVTMIWAGDVGGCSPWTFQLHQALFLSCQEAGNYTANPLTSSRQARTYACTINIEVPCRRRKRKDTISWLIIRAINAVC